MKKIQKLIFNRYILLTLLLLLFIFVSALSYATTVSYDIQNSVFRLHVIANSDEEYDQNLKYIVRDEILKYVNSISSNAVSKEDVIELVKTNSDEIKKIAEETIITNGYNYSVNVNIGNFEFPTKTYGDLSLPAGLYDALRVEIGKAEGANWWCVMFPPLCFVDVSSGVVPTESKEVIKNNLANDEEYDLLVASNAEVKFKFKLVEMFQSFGI